MDKHLTNKTKRLTNIAANLSLNMYHDNEGLFVTEVDAHSTESHINSQFWRLNLSLSLPSSTFLDSSWGTLVEVGGAPCILLYIYPPPNSGDILLGVSATLAAPIRIKNVYIWLLIIIIEATNRHLYRFNLSTCGVASPPSWWLTSRMGAIQNTYNRIKMI